MSMSFSVRVVDQDGDPMSGIKVTADFGLLHGQSSDYTDDGGWAMIEASGDYVTCTIYVKGENQGEHPISDGDTFSFTIED